MLAIVVMLGFAVLADEPTKTRPLFDGKTLEGWKATDFHRVKELTIAVKDGAIVLPQGCPMSGITSTRDDLPKVDYELTYEASRTAGEDFFAAATFPVGESFLTFVNGGWGGNITGLSSLSGMDASENETGKFFKYENNRWYRFRVAVSAKTVRCWIDDKPVVTLETQGRQLGTRIESRASQPLGFATYRSAGLVRNIKIRILTTEEVKLHDKVEARDNKENNDPTNG